MDPLVVAIVVIAVIGLVAVRPFAARRVAEGDGRFVWVIFAPVGVCVAGFAVASISLIEILPVVGILSTIISVLFVVTVVRLGAQIARRASDTTSSDAFADAVTEPMTQFVFLWMGLLLAGALVAVVVLIVWGISKTAS